MSSKDDSKQFILHPEIEGLSYLESFINKLESEEILKEIDALPWLSGDGALSRRTQHYGYLYNYKSRSIPEMATPFPSFASKLAKRLSKLGVFEQLPDQLIVNEYLPGQGISAHVDQPKIFGPVVVSISVIGNSMMVFRSKTSKQEVNLWFPERTIVILQNDARYEWTHAIPGRRSDILSSGAKLPRSRRISLTFRTINRN